MTDNLVYFAHGKESGPWGRKIQDLAKVAQDQGFVVESPDYSTTMNPYERVEMLLSQQPQATNLVLVGSSMGGFVSTIASQKLHPAGLFLLAPAFYMPGYTEHVPSGQIRELVVVHGWQDAIIPVTHSIRFAQEYQAQLYILNSDHQLLDQLPLLCQLFKLFLERIKSGGQNK